MSTLAQRNALYARLEEVLGTEHAVTLMTHMPIELDLPTKADFAALSERIDSRFDAIAGRFESTDSRFDMTDSRFDAIVSRFEQIDTRFDANDSRFDRLEAHMVRFEDKLDGFHEALRDQSRTYMVTMSGVMASFAAVIIATGILT